MSNMSVTEVFRDGYPVRAGLLMAMVWLLAACATPGGAGRAPAEPAGEPVPEEVVAAPAPEPEVVQEQPLTADLMFDILLGEIAGQRGRLDVATPHYLQAALESDDPQVAERAVQIATFAKQYDVALRAARHWLELDSSSVEARKMVTALALKLGDTDEVVRQLDHIITSAEDPEEGFQLATAILARHTDKQTALQASEQLAARYPASAQAQLSVCRLAILAEDLERALAAVDRALQLQPGLPEARILKAQVLIRLERKQQALQVLEQAVGQQPDNVELRFAYGRMLIDAGDLEGAKQQFSRVVALEPGNADALYSLALLELETGELKPAERHLRRLLEFEDKQQSACYYLGYTAQERGDNEAALEWYGKVEEGEYWTQSRLRMARIMIEQGRVNEVRREMQTIRRNNPDNAIDFYLIEGQALSDAAFHKEAYALYTEALVGHPDDENLLYARALTAEQLDRIDLAEQDMRRILELDPNNVRTLNALGYTLADRTERYEESLLYIQQAYAQKPDDPAIIDSMGWVHYRLGKLDAARDYLQQAWDMTGDGEIGAHLGEVLWMQGRQDEARRVWEQSRENAPDNPVLKEVINRFMP